MSSLLLKDVLNLRKYFRTIVIALVFYCFLSFNMDNTSFLSGMIIMLFVMIPITSFSYDQQSKWDSFALSLPFSRKDLVLSKYLLSLCFIVSGCVIGLVIGYLMTSFKDSAVFVMKEQLLTVYALFAVGVIFVSILLPLIYKFGVERSRIMMLVVFLIPTAIVASLNKMGFTIPTDMNYKLLLIISPFVLLLIFTTSFLISLKIYTKKDL